jgi:hypothetical protein
METPVQPVVGQWYRSPAADKGEIFQVVDVDAEDDTIEVQYFDGDIEELSDEEWRSRSLKTCAPPEDWTGPYDGVRSEDLGYSDTDMAADEEREAADVMATEADDDDEDDVDEADDIVAPTR